MSTPAGTGWADLAAEQRCLPVRPQDTGIVTIYYYDRDMCARRFSECVDVGDHSAGFHVVVPPTVHYLMRVQLDHGAHIADRSRRYALRIMEADKHVQYYRGDEWYEMGDRWSWRMQRATTTNPVTTLRFVSHALRVELAAAEARTQALAEECEAMLVVD